MTSILKDAFSFFKKNLPYIFLFFIVLILFFYFRQHGEIFLSIRSISINHIFLLIGFEFIATSINALVNYFLLRQFGVSIRLYECFYLQNITTLLNKIIPTIGSGAAFRAVFLKEKYEFSYSNFAASLAGLYVINFISNAVLAILCLVIIFFRSQVYNFPITLAFIFLFIISLMIIIFSPNRINQEGKLFAKINGVLQGWQTIRGHTKMVLMYIVLSIIFLIITAFSTAVSYQALGYTTDPVAMVLLSTLGILTALFNLTPGGIGIKEAIYVFSGNLIFLPNAALILGSLVIHAVTILFYTVTGAISYLMIMLSKNRKSDFPDID